MMACKIPTMRRLFPRWCAWVLRQVHDSIHTVPTLGVVLHVSAGVLDGIHYYLEHVDDAVGLERALALELTIYEMNPLGYVC